tara:strand:- start:586 stop:936 length:351 start_codon:yes stop_codon:yes gene_type:complete
MRALLLLLLLPASAAAQTITPQFTQGSMTATTTSTQTIDEVIVQEVYGAAVTKYSGENVTPSTNITDSSATWSVTTAGDPWTLEITERSAGIIETIDIDRTIDTESTTTSLSVFSQ